MVNTYCPLMVVLGLEPLQPGDAELGCLLILVVSTSADPGSRVISSFVPSPPLPIP